MRTVLVATLGLAACGGATTVTAPAMTTTTTVTAMPASVMTGMMMYREPYLTDAHGRTLYYFTQDEAGISHADAATIATWPVFYAADVMVDMPLDGMDFGTITRSDGARQTTFRGFPLYYYVGDMRVWNTPGSP